MTTPASSLHDWFLALKDSARRDILVALCGGPKTVTGIGRAVGRDHHQISYSLRKLLRGGLVRCEKHGRHVVYATVGVVVRDGRLVLTHSGTGTEVSLAMERPSVTPAAEAKAVWDGSSTSAELPDTNWD